MNFDYKLIQLRRWLVCRRLYGHSNAMKMLLRAGSTTRRRTLRLPNGRPFTFRGKVDIGVLSHFSIEGCFIEDSPERPIRTIVDGGANIGDETARFHLHYPHAQIVAIEPESGNFEMLEANFRGVENVHLLNGGLWSSICRLKVNPPASGNLEAFRVVETAEETGSIRAVTVDSLLAEMRWKEIDILKLDIEGAEHELFTRNCERWIGKVNAFVFEVPDSDHPGTTQEIFRALGDRTFDTYVCGENLVLIKRGLGWKFCKVAGLSEPRLRENGFL